MTSSGNWTYENLHDDPIDTLPFEKRLGPAVLWHLELPAVIGPVDKKEILEWRREHGVPICEPVTYYPSSERGENASTRRAEVAEALLEWLDSTGALPEFLCAEDPQSDESLTQVDRLWAERSDDLTMIQAKIREIDSDENLRSFLKHMFKRCPWLGREWPGTATSAEVNSPSQDAAGSPAGADVPDNARSSSREIAEKAGMPSVLPDLHQAIMGLLGHTDRRLTREQIAGSPGPDQQLTAKELQWQRQIPCKTVRAISAAVGELIGWGLVEERCGKRQGVARTDAERLL